MAMGKFGRRVFEFAPPSASRFGDLEVRRRFHEELLKLSVASGTTITWGLIPPDHVADEELPLLDRAAAAGGKLIGHSPSCMSDERLVGAGWGGTVKLRVRWLHYNNNK